ncbi:MAG: hypothetical protein QG654_479 [Patescibacteria group bacterium]|jgi:hypothetical protein|nr:hypothetical protein [Patescibacteria group bacterium]
MKKLGVVSVMPVEKIGVGKYKFMKFRNGEIKLYEIKNNEEILLAEFKNIEDLKLSGEKYGFFHADISFVSKFL